MGKVQADLTIKVMSAVDFGTNIGALHSFTRGAEGRKEADFMGIPLDFNTYDSLVEVNHLYKEIFYD